MRFDSFLFTSLPLLSFFSSRGLASAPAAFVKLRIEGASGTIFEGHILDTPRNVTTASGGTHQCDGTNNGANPTPGPTCTGALDIASNNHHFSYDGTWDTSFEDYFITSISTDAQTSMKFWGLLLNYQFTEVGGCQQQVDTNDEVLWAFDAFSKEHSLKLEGPGIAHRNQTITVRVTDGASGIPAAGATIRGETTAADGSASFVFGEFGPQKLKAERSDSIRSNALEILVVI